MTERVFEQDAYAQLCDAIVVACDENGVILDRTVFYPLGGGQPGDRGQLVLADGARVTVVDPVKGNGGAIVHRVEGDTGALARGTRVTAAIDWPRR